VVGIKALRGKQRNQNCDDAYVKRKEYLDSFFQLRQSGFAASPKIVLINRWSGQHDYQLKD
jgi:hypothetical protein